MVAIVLSSSSTTTRSSLSSPSWYQQPREKRQIRTKTRTQQQRHEQQHQRKQLLPSSLILLLLSVNIFVLSIIPVVQAQNSTEAPTFAPTIETTTNTTAAATTTTNNTEEDSSSNNNNIDYEGQSLLALRWKLIYTSLYYDGLRFDLEYTTSDFIQTNMVKYTLYDGHAACETNDGINIINDSGYFTIDLVGDGTPVGGGLETRQMTLSTTIDPSTIRDSPSYEESEDETSATIKFCVRLGVHDGDVVADPNIEEINHQITTITLNVDLTDDFKIEDTNVEALETGQETTDDKFFIEGFICDENNIKPQDMVPLNQGQTIKVCVQPTPQALDVGFRVRRIDKFTFTQEYLTQDAVVDGRAAINGLTDLECEPGSEICTFETLLLSYFYTEFAFLVTGTGEATLQFGSSPITRHNRDLVVQQQQKKKVQLRFRNYSNGHHSSSSSTTQSSFDHHRSLQQGGGSGGGAGGGDSDRLLKRFDIDSFGVQRQQNNFQYPSSSAAGSTVTTTTTTTSSRRNGIIVTTTSFLISSFFMVPMLTMFL